MGFDTIEINLVRGLLVVDLERVRDPCMTLLTSNTNKIQ